MMRSSVQNDRRIRPEFFIFGVGGYVARRHVTAIRLIGGKIIGACDVHDAVGILDSASPDAHFFLDPDSAREFLSRSTHDSQRFCVICTPTDRHLEHAEIALAQGWNVICEKPVVLNEEQYRVLRATESAAPAASVWPVLQMRFHPALMALRDALRHEPPAVRHDVELTYLTPRGSWYGQSWKGDPGRSGGLALNIGIHLFDALTWIFGRTVAIRLNAPAAEDHLSGVLTLERADVLWTLSTRPQAHPGYRTDTPLLPIRSMTVDGRTVDFSASEDLHTEVYRAVLRGSGPRLPDALESLALSGEVQRLAQGLSAAGDAR